MIEEDSPIVSRINDDLGRRNHRHLRTGSRAVQFRAAGGPIEHYERLRGEVDRLAKGLLRDLVDRLHPLPQICPDHACLEELPRVTIACLMGTCKYNTVAHLAATTAIESLTLDFSTLDSTEIH